MVGHNYLFLESKQVENDAGFEWNMHRLLILAQKSDKYCWSQKAIADYIIQQWNKPAYIYITSLFDTTTQSSSPYQNGSVGVHYINSNNNKNLNILI